MKTKAKFLISFVILSSLIILYINYKDTPITIINGSFSLNQSSFYPVALNYLVSLQTDGDDLWTSPTSDYGLNKKYLHTRKDSCLIQLKKDMLLIKSLGFNTVRVVGVGETWFSENKEDLLSIGVDYGNDSIISLKLNALNYMKYLEALGEMVKVIDESDLKVILLLKISPDNKSTETQLIRVSSYFKGNKTILAFDLFNEPLYFDKKNRTKKEVFDIVNRWDKILNFCDNTRLSTIGLVGVREVLEWDPSILNVDFISYHPYEHESEQVRNEMFWYKYHTQKPWIIGETSISADNDSVSYKAQRFFAKKTIQQAYSCGAAGYSWWQFKDVEWYNFNANFMGLITQNNTIKPASEEFGNFSSLTKGACLCLDNYYNYSKHVSFKVKGILTDTNQNPIEGAVILAWNKSWDKSDQTYTKKNGSFELYGNHPFYHWKASAPKYTATAGIISPDTSYIENGIPTINLGRIHINTLNFH